MMIFFLVLMILCFLYAALVLRFTFGLYTLKTKGGGHQETKPGELPRLSVVVAARNEAAGIQDLLKALLVQRYPVSDYEVIIVDDHSADQTAEKVQAFIREAGIGNMLVLRAAEQERVRESGKKYALALGISRASGTYVLTTDADCRPGPDWLKAIAEHLIHEPADMLIGPVRLAPLKGLFGRLQALEFHSLTGVAAGAAAAGMPVLCSGANLTFRRNVFEEVGGYSSHLDYPSGDDVFLLQSFRRRAGSKIDYVMDKRAVVETRPAPGLKAFFRQRARWVSKSGGYTDKAVMASGGVVAGMNAGLIIAAILCLFQQSICISVLLVFLFKLLIDFFLIGAAAVFLNQRKLLWLYLPLSILYPFYVCFSLLSGSLWQRKW